jgi:hypothetical protein
VLADARALVEHAAKTCKYAEAFELCKSKDGHGVPALRIRQPGVKDAERRGIWIHARQHAWECGSSWVCRGVVDWLISEDPAAESLRKQATITIVPIMDVDNVERGCGGKNQKPHDHNRDWSDTPVWPEVAAAMAAIQKQAKAQRFDLFLDLHNPAPGDHQPFFFVPAGDLLSAEGRGNLERFLESARAEITGPLKLRPKARESGPKYDRNWERISGNWVAKHTQPHVVAACLETSWNTPQSTAENYRTVGRQLGKAVERYLRKPGR